MGQKRKKKMKWEKDTILAYAAEKLYAKYGFKEGDEFTYKTFVIEGYVFTVSTVKMVKKEEITIGEKKMKLNKYISSIEAMPGIEMTEWRDDEYKLIRSDIPAMNMSMILSTKKTSGLEAVDFTSQMLIKCKTKLLPSTEVLYRLKSKKGEISTSGWEDQRQKIEKKAKDEILLRVKQVLPDEKKIYQIPFKAKNMEEYLEDNAVIQCKDEVLKKTAREIIGPEKNAWKAACLIEKWVSRHIKTKNFAVGFASAKEVLQTKEGDCTEHAVLLAALTRAVGIPSRLIGGLTYFELEDKRYFGHHMWTEVFVGEWIALDGTQPAGGIDARYISFDKTSLKGGTMPPELAAAMAIKIFGQLSVGIIEQQPKK